MTIKQIAADFNMTVKEFAEYLGYSRVAMYCTNAAVSHKKTRVKAAVRLLCSLNQSNLMKKCKKQESGLTNEKKRLPHLKKCFWDMMLERWREVFE